MGNTMGLVANRNPSVVAFICYAVVREVLFCTDVVVSFEVAGSSAACDKC